MKKSSPRPSRITLTGAITVPEADLTAVLDALPQHIALTRAEPGCLVFEVTQHDDAPQIFDVYEEFSDQAAFDAHQARAGESAWAAVTTNVERSYTITEEE